MANARPSATSHRHGRDDDRHHREREQRDRQHTLVVGQYERPPDVRNDDRHSTQASRRAIVWARSRTCAVVFRPRNVAPCSRHQHQQGDTHPQSVQVSRFQNDPVELLIRTHRQAGEQVTEGHPR